jgi:hypothetical protein
MKNQWQVNKNIAKTDACGLFLAMNACCIACTDSLSAQRTAGWQALDFLVAAHSLARIRMVKASTPHCNLLDQSA